MNAYHPNKAKVLHFGSFRCLPKTLQKQGNTATKMYIFAAIYGSVSFTKRKSISEMLKNQLNRLFFCVFALFVSVSAFAGDTPDLKPGETYNPTPDILHHIADANEYHLFGDVSIPLPVILYAPDQGFTFTMSNAFHHGENSVDGYVMYHGKVYRAEKGLSKDGKVDIKKVEKREYYDADSVLHSEMIAIHEGGETKLESSSTLMSFTSFYDFSISKIVAIMLIVLVVMAVLFIPIARKYKSRDGKAPTGVQNLFEVFVVFMTDEVIKPIVGPRYMKFLPFLLTLFFFILFCNLFGLIPFIGNPNVSGNIAFTLALATIVFLVVSFSGNLDYWKHIFWMPDVPVPMKIFLAPIEVIGMFAKPFSLMIRLFANITAGHIVILSLVSLIFIFGQLGESIGGASVGAVLAVLFVIFMNIVELLVAFLQAFIFVVLASLYIGSAVEEHAHH